MKRSLIIMALLLFSVSPLPGQRIISGRKNIDTKSNGNLAVIIDERLSLLREAPSLYAQPLKRLKTGTKVTVMEEEKNDGVVFYKVAEVTALVGWIQAEGLTGTFRKNDDQRVAQLILGSRGFVQVQRSVVFLDLFDKSPFRPTILLLLGDIIEEEAGEITKRANEALLRREMAAAKAPFHSFYLNYIELDRYTLLGIKFLFNGNTRTLHYNGDSWFEITRNFPESPLSIEARERIKSLTDKMKASE